MSCCGQKRLQWQQKLTHQEPAWVSYEPVLENSVSLQYNGISSCLIKGPQTGYLYLFAVQETGLMVDGRDVDQLLEKSQKFSLA